MCHLQLHWSPPNPGQGRRPPCSAAAHAHDARSRSRGAAGTGQNARRLPPHGSRRPRSAASCLGLPRTAPHRPTPPPAGGAASREQRGKAALAGARRLRSGHLHRARLEDTRTLRQRGPHLFDGGAGGRHALGELLEHHGRAPNEEEPDIQVPLRSRQFRQEKAFPKPKPGATSRCARKTSVTSLPGRNPSRSLQNVVRDHTAVVLWVAAVVLCGARRAGAERAAEAAPPQRTGRRRVRHRERHHGGRPSSPLAACSRRASAAAPRAARAHARPFCRRHAGAAWTCAPRARRVRGPRGRALTCGAACGARQSELLSDEKLAEFNEAFDLFDKKKEGKIPSQDLIVVFQAMKLNLSKREEQEYLAVPTRHARVARTSPAAALRPHGSPLLAPRAVRIVTWPWITDARP